ncbi:amino acid adenylation domain-containing protein [Streptomyces sp. NPDC041068]|uniref:non-ribosomal peptide synthetase n=1 Tax=Streptomyces sp. NPDC041068 TaxID=3155130 RepID=UPI0033CA3724
MNRPASPGQSRFYLLDAQDGGAARTLVKHIAVEGPADPDRLRRALRTVLAEHPALRTSLHLGDDGLVQRPHPVDDVPLSVTEHADPDAALDTERAALAVPFTHGAGPLCAIRVLLGARRTHCLISVHHAVFDDDSTAILFAALVAAYEADATAAAGPDPAQPPSLAATERDRLRTYWAGQLAGAPQSTELPWSTEAVGRRRETRERALADDVSAALRERARHTGASPFAQFLSAVALVTSWYLDRTDVVFAVPVSGRDAGGAQRVDCLQNTVPVRVDLAGADTEMVVERTVDALLDALDHRDMPFEDILDSAGVARRTGRKPLAQILVTETAPVPERNAAGLRWRVGETVAQEVEYDACLALCHGPDGGMRVELSYRAGGLPPVRAQHTVDHVVRLLGRLAAGKAEPQAALDLLDDAERHELAVLDGTLPMADESDDRAVAAAAADSVPARILRHARTTPDAVAVTAGEHTLTYAELARRSAVVAADLARHGVRPGDRVGICLGRDTDLLAALLGVWRTGALYVPLDPDYPAERLRYVTEDSSLAAVVADRDIPVVADLAADFASDPAPALVEIDALRRRWGAPEASDATYASYDLEARDAPVDAQGRAYLIHTSGSTGRPKGVVVGHGQLVALCDALDEVLPDAPVSVAGTSLSFDISALELFWPLTRGRTVLLTRHRQVSREPVPEGALYQCTPTVARMLADDGEGRAVLSRLGALLVGGEPLPSDLADDLAALVPGPVLNCYGPTETTVWSTVWPVGRGARVGIGLPLPGESCHVVDSLGRLLPPGCPGRLVITGAGVAEGYWRRPDLTEERFAALPGTGGRRGYDTGDLVVLHGPDGLRFLGRRDSQCKILGQRVELEEVEAALRSAPDVAAVAVAPDATSTHLVAFVVDASAQGASAQGASAQGASAQGASAHGASERSASAQGVEPPHDGPPRPVAADRLPALRGHAESWLPQAMVPSVWCRVAALPQLPNGKLDRGTLARWAAAPQPTGAARATAVRATAAQTTAARQPEAPVGSAHQQVRLVWERVLGRPVAPTDHDTTFFDLGGTSAGVLRVLAALRPDHPGLTIGDLFRHTTLRSLAEHMARPGKAPVPEPRTTKDTTSAIPSGATTGEPSGTGRGQNRSRALGAWRARRAPGGGPPTAATEASTPSRTESRTKK